MLYITKQKTCQEGGVNWAKKRQKTDHGFYAQISQILNQ